MKEAIINRLLSFSLRTHLLMMAFMLALPAFMLIIHTGLNQRQDAIDEGISEGRKLVYNIATEQYNLTGDAEQLLTVLAQLPEIKNHNKSATNKILADVLKNSPQYGNIGIADRFGNVWASGLPFTKSISVGDRLAFRKAVKTRQFSSGDFSIGRITAKPSIGYGYPLINTLGYIEGVILVSLNFSHLNELLQHSALPKGSTYSIIDCHGVIIDRNLNPAKYIGTKVKEDIFQSMINGDDEASTADFESADNNAINSYRKLTMHGEQSPYLYIRTSIPLQETQGKALHALIFNIATLSAILLVAIIIVMFMGNFVFLQRIRKLQEASQRLSEGDLEIKVSEMVQGAELGSLGRTFDEMARNLSLRESALVRSKFELSDLYNNAPCGYHSLNKDGVIIRINDTELNWLGYSREEVVGIKTFMNIITPEGQKELEKSFPFLKEQGWVRDLEFDMIRKDGSTITVLMSATAVRDTDGSFVMSRSVSQDITTRKQIEKKLNDLNQSLAKRIDIETEKRLNHERLLARNARLVAIGEMIGAIAHQWRQPLATLGA
ncbi:MAG: PAS domain-containing protein, partial [Oryzomonas sp.]